MEFSRKPACPGSVPEGDPSPSPTLPAYLHLLFFLSQKDRFPLSPCSPTPGPSPWPCPVPLVGDPSVGDLRVRLCPQLLSPATSAGAVLLCEERGNPRFSSLSRPHSGRDPHPSRAVCCFPHHLCFSFLQSHACWQRAASPQGPGGDDSMDQDPGALGADHRKRCWRQQGGRGAGWALLGLTSLPVLTQSPGWWLFVSMPESP